MDIHQQITAPCTIVETSANFLTPNSRVLDLACGGGRNGRYLLALGHNVTFLDRDVEGVADLVGVTNAEVIKADLEDDSDWPLDNRQFDLVIVANYLWRPILRKVFNSVTIGGTIAYETFALGNEVYGKPSNPNYLLAENELLTATYRQYDISLFSSGNVVHPKSAVKQRLIAKRRPATLEKTIGDVVLSDDPLRLDIDVIHGFLANSYWAKGIGKDRLEMSINESLCMGLYGDEGQQIGFARFVTNKCSFSYLKDVFVLPDYQGRGYGKLLVEAMLAHPTQQKIKRIVLMTDDAFDLYAHFGFERIGDTNIMCLNNANWLE